MRRFRFRLQSILSLREHQLDRRRIELGAISSQCADLRNRIDDRLAARREILASRDEAARSDDVTHRLAVEGYAARLADEAGRLRRDLATAEEHRAVAAVAFREAKRNADVLQKLKERREADYMRAQKRDEQHRLDEISQRIHLRSEE